MNIAWGRSKIKESNGSLDTGWIQKTLISVYRMVMILFTEETKDDVLQEALSEGDQLIQKILSDTGSWYVDWDGIRRISARGKLEFACPHLIFPIGRLVDAETGAMKTKLSYRRKGQPWQTTIVERNVLASSRSIIALADLGVAVTSNSAPLLVEFLNEVQERHYFEIEELVCIGRMGYIPKLGFIPYVKEVLFAGELCFNTIYQSIREEGTYCGRVQIYASYLERSFWSKKTF